MIDICLPDNTWAHDASKCNNILRNTREIKHFCVSLVGTEPKPLLVYTNDREDLVPTATGFGTHCTVGYVSHYNTRNFCLESHAF